MTEENIKKLTAVILDRYASNRDNTEATPDDGRTPNEYTPEENIEAAIEEAWLNDELDFLTANQ